jgi:hypothetical protein
MPSGILLLVYGMIWFYKALNMLNIAQALISNHNTITIDKPYPVYGFINDTKKKFKIWECVKGTVS